MANPNHGFPIGFFAGFLEYLTSLHILWYNKDNSTYFEKGVEMFMTFWLVRIMTVLVLGVLFIWAPGVLDVVYYVNGMIWSPVAQVLMWILPERWSTALWGVLTFLEYGTSGAEWIAGWIPYYGVEARAILKLLLHGAGILTTISIVFFTSYFIRKWRRRPKH